MSELSEIPFFVVGNPRSGTTLLRYMLSSHPRLYIPSETGFLPYMGLSPDKYLSKVQVAQLLDRVGKLNRQWANLVPDLDVFRAELHKPTLPHILDALYRIQIEPFDAQRWGDKTPTYIRYIPEILNIFPGARFIHVVRDGRDASLSAQKKWRQRHFYMDQTYLLKSWVEHIELGQAAGTELGATQYLEIRYEMLVTEPEKVLRDICQFLDEDFHAAMLDHTQLARRTIGDRGHVEVRKELSINSVQRWQNQLTNFEKKLADTVAGPILDSLDYPRAELGRFTFTERIRYSFILLRYQIINLGRKILTGLGLLRINRGKHQK